jgi:hypothetical protein
MRKILIIIGLLISLTGYGQDIVNKRIMLDSLNAARLSLSNYLLAADTAYMHTRLDSTINALKDTIPISTVLDINLTTDTVADLSEVRLRQAYADSRSVMAFGAGGGNAGDTTLFTTSTLYGSPYWGGTKSFHVDTMLVSMVHGLGLDTIDVQISWSDTLKAVVPTKLNTAALPIGRAAGVNKALTVGQIDLIMPSYHRVR